MMGIWSGMHTLSEFWGQLGKWCGCGMCNVCTFVPFESQELGTCSDHV